MIAERLQALRVKFIERSRDDCARLLDALDDPAPDLDIVGSVAHRLSGGGGTVGLPEISIAAAAVEDACDAGDVAALRDAVRTLCAVVDRLLLTSPASPR